MMIELSATSRQASFVVASTIVVGLVPFLWNKKKATVASALSRKLSKWTFPLFDRYSLVGAGPYYDTLTCLETLERNCKTIQDEMDSKIMPELDHLFTLNRHVKPMDESQQQLLDRRAFFFSIFGHDFSASRHYCPETAAVLDSIPDVRVAFFSILPPRTRITRHAGQWNKGLVRCHLGLKIPNTPTCRIEVGGESRCWKEGQVLCFDETSPHEAWNDSNEYRVVLIVDVLRPLRFPMKFANWCYLELVVMTTKIRQGLSDIIDWEETFHKEREQRKVT